ncbi:MAG: hypothetical protein FWH22_09435, partial [Fibromonadales bacterium]|nr:hypothetical protein [Fibromonadales bacterium]
EPKPAALPLGDTPKLTMEHKYRIFLGYFQGQILEFLFYIRFFPLTTLKKIAIFALEIALRRLADEN